MEILCNFCWKTMPRYTTIQRYWKLLRVENSLTVLGYWVSAALMGTLETRTTDQLWVSRIGTGKSNIHQHFVKRRCRDETTRQYWMPLCVENPLTSMGSWASAVLMEMLEARTTDQSRDSRDHTRKLKMDQNLLNNNAEITTTQKYGTPPRWVIPLTLRGYWVSAALKEMIRMKTTDQFRGLRNPTGKFNMDQHLLINGAEINTNQKYGLPLRSANPLTLMGYWASPVLMGILMTRTAVQLWGLRIDTGEFDTAQHYLFNNGREINTAQNSPMPLRVRNALPLSRYGANRKPHQYPPSISGRHASFGTPIHAPYLHIVPRFRTTQWYYHLHQRAPEAVGVHASIVYYTSLQIYTCFVPIDKNIPSSQSIPKEIWSTVTTGRRKYLI